MDKHNLEKYLKYGLGVILIGIGGFAGLFLIKSIVALAITIVGGLALWNFTPVIAQAMAQLKIMGHVALARVNPIPDLWLQYKKKMEALEESAQAVTQFSQEVKDYAGKLQAFIERRPARAVEFQSTHDNMQKVLAIRLAKLRQAKDKLAEFQNVIYEAEDVWSMTQAAIKANKAMKKFDGVDPLDEIRQKTALDAVTSSLNQVMAELETSMTLDYSTLTDESPAIAHQSATVVDFKILPEKSHVPNPR